MPRTMLQLRIEALSQHLEQAQDPYVWKKKLDLPKFNVDDNLWYRAVEKIYEEAGELHRMLVKLEAQLRRGEINEREGWRRYHRVQRASEEVFQECLDLLGGLALRDRIQDERICRVADEYIKELASDTGRRESFSIPGLDARLSSTLRRVAKMQFPEWTVWTLPLVAHEYGHVVVEESGLRNYAASLTCELAEADIRSNHAALFGALLDRGVDPGLALRLLGPRETEAVEALFRPAPGAAQATGPDHGPGAAPVEELRAVYDHHRQRVRILLADALATLLAGPAYAYAALLLRLNPLADDRQVVADQDRAATILAVLKFMNQAPAGQPPPHGDIVGALEEYWRQSVAAAQATPVGDATPELNATPPIDPGQVQDNFREHLVSHKRASYERRHSVQAQSWSDSWTNQLMNGMALSTPPLADDQHIRESLNAAWRARVAATSNLDPTDTAEATIRVELLGEAALELCDAIIRQRAQDRLGSDPGGGTELGPAKRPT